MTRVRMSPLRLEALTSHLQSTAKGMLPCGFQLQDLMPPLQVKPNFATMRLDMPLCPAGSISLGCVIA